MPKLPTIFSKRSTASADDLEKQAGAARKASMLESMEMAEAIEMLHISAESVVSFTVLLRSSRTQEVKELLLGVGELDLTLREPAPAGGRASRTPMLTFPIDDLVAWLPNASAAAEAAVRDFFGVCAAPAAPALPDEDLLICPITQEEFYDPVITGS